jgi:hypothetical protein
MVNDTFEFIGFEEKILAFKRGEDSACIYVFLNLDDNPVYINHKLSEGVYVEILDEKQTLYKSNLLIQLNPGDFLVLISA